MSSKLRQSASKKGLIWTSIVVCGFGLCALVVSRQPVNSAERSLDGLLAGIASDCANIGSQDKAPIEQRVQKCVGLYPPGFGLWKGRSVCVNASVEVWSDVLEKGESSAILCFVAVSDSPPEYRLVFRKHHKWEFMTTSVADKLPARFVVVEKPLVE